MIQWKRLIRGQGSPATGGLRLHGTQSHFGDSGEEAVCPIFVSSAHDAVTQWHSGSSWGHCSGPLFPAHHEELNGFSFVLAFCHHPCGGGDVGS